MIKSTGNPGDQHKNQYSQVFSGKACCLNYLLLGNLECPDTCLRCTVGVQKENTSKKCLFVLIGYVKLDVVYYCMIDVKYWHLVSKAVFLMI